MRTVPALRRFTLITLCAAICWSSHLSTAAAAPPEPPAAEESADVNVPEGALDPASYEGPLIVATEDGDIVVGVERGAAGLFLDRSDGSLQSLSPEAARLVENNVRTMAACTGWIRSVAGPFDFMKSQDGCAVAGYPGYVRQYVWQNSSDMTICVRGKGFENGEIWRSIGCSNAGGQGNVPWGNALAYTRVSALSMSGATNANFDWWP